MMSRPFDSVSLVGLGYIGLPTAVVFALRGIRTIGLDIDPLVVEMINRGEVHIVETGLEEALKRAVVAGHLRATTVPEPADAFLIAVPTPFIEADDERKPDLSYVEKASRSIAPTLKRGDLVVLESTSPVGATEKMAEWLAEERPDLTFPQTHGEDSDIRIAHCPERILPGHALSELVTNDRIIGGMTEACSARARKLYQLVVEGDCIETDCRTAEMAKLTENSFRDVNIAFANELSLICDRLGINVWTLIRVANRHPRVNILQPGPGVGGHCIAVDPWFIVSQAPEEARLIRIAREVNDDKPTWVVGQVHQAVDDHQRATGASPRIACFGLAFKPNIDDLRESPALSIVSQLADSYPGDIRVIEPYIRELPPQLSGRAKLSSISDALVDCDIAVMLVDHEKFKSIPYPKDRIGRIIDTRGIWDGVPN